MENMNENKYLIKETIATGGMATIYKGVQISLNREVVIKKLHPHLGQDANFVKRFKREAAILAKLKHENIVSIIDFYEKENDKFIVLEYIKGKSLKNLINEKGKIPFDYALIIIKDILKGLNYIHSQQILHRDLKPDNIMLSENGTAKITDFGLAFGKELINVTNPGTYLGTPSYFPPEQLMGNQITVSSDIFSLGITIVEMITGKNPFEGKDQFETINNILYFKNVSFEYDSDKIPPLFIETLNSMLNRDPSRRPVSCQDILNTLEKIQIKVSEDDFLNFIFVKSEERIELKDYLKVRIRKKNKYLEVFIFIFLLTILIILILFQVNFLMRSYKVKTIYLTDKTEKYDIFLNSAPAGMQISINDSIVVLTPRKINLNKGFYSFKLLNKDYIPVDTLVEIVKDDTLFFKFEKRKVIESYGYLSLNVLPWADVYIDGMLIDKTPLTKNIRLITGKHILKLVHPNRKEYIKEIEIMEDKILKLDIELEKSYGYFKIIVRPWGKVTIDDHVIGFTPISDSIKLLIGPHKIKIENPYYPTIEDEIYIKEEELLKKLYSF